MSGGIRPIRNNHPVAMEEEKHAKISIWWDIESCQVPRNCTPHWVIINMMHALRRADFMGEISIFVFGNTFEIKEDVLAQLNRAGFTINHVPGGTDAADKKMIAQMLIWASENPSPANILVISGDIDFWRTLDELKYLNYNIMLAHRTTKPLENPPMDIIWMWSNLLSGQPPSPVLPASASASSSARARARARAPAPAQQIWVAQRSNQGV